MLRAWPKLFVAALLFASPLGVQSALAESDGLRLARNRFEFGQYQEAMGIIDAMHSEKLLAEEEDLKESWRMHGLSAFYMGNQAVAKQSFLKLLKLDPDYLLDPVLVSPAAIDLFEMVRAENEELLSLIREQRREALRHLEESKRRVQVMKMPFIAALVPGGAPQFQQGRPLQGALLATGQALALAGTVATWAQFRSLRNEEGRFEREDFRRAQNWRAANWAFFGTVLGLYALGVVDASFHLEEVGTVTAASAGPGLTLTREGLLQLALF